MTAILLGLAVVGILDSLLRLPYLRDFPIGVTRVMTFVLAFLLGIIFQVDPIAIFAAVGGIVILEMIFTREPADTRSLDYRTDLQEKPPRVTAPR